MELMSEHFNARHNKFNNSLLCRGGGVLWEEGPVVPAVLHKDRCSRLEGFIPALLGYSGSLPKLLLTVLVIGLGRKILNSDLFIVKLPKSDSKPLACRPETSLMEMVVVLIG